MVVGFALGIFRMCVDTPVTLGLAGLKVDTNQDRYFGSTTPSFQYFSVLITLVFGGGYGGGAAACEPQFFGFAPVQAANTALKRAGIGWGDVAAVELNEAFAAQSVACVRAWDIDPAIVNAHGGAIAIGHPLGASGTRILGTLARSLAASGRRWGVAAICIGVGQGLAIVLENAGR